MRVALSFWCRERLNKTICGEREKSSTSSQISEYAYTSIKWPVSWPWRHNPHSQDTFQVGDDLCRPPRPSKRGFPSTYCAYAPTPICRKRVAKSK